MRGCLPTTKQQLVMYLNRRFQGIKLNTVQTGLGYSCPSEGGICRMVPTLWEHISEMYNVEFFHSFYSHWVFLLVIALQW